MDYRHRLARDLRKNMTDAERRLWRHLRAHRLNGSKFRRQQPMGPYIVDFVHFGARVVVEADGGQHQNSEADKQRDAWLQQQGFRVLRFWNNDILQNTEGVLEVILNAVAPSPPTPLPRGERGVKGTAKALSPEPGQVKKATAPPDSPELGQDKQAAAPSVSPEPGQATEATHHSPLPSRERGRGEGEKTNSTGKQHDPRTTD